MLAACGVEMPVIDEQPEDGAIAGRVVDADTDAAVEAATIVTLPATAIAVSDADGAFTISQVAPGTYSVVARKDGYVPDTVTGVVVAGQTISVQAALLRK